MSTSEWLEGTLLLGTNYPIRAEFDHRFDLPQRHYRQNYTKWSDKCHRKERTALIRRIAV